MIHNDLYKSLNKKIVTNSGSDDNLLDQTKIINNIHSSHKNINELIKNYINENKLEFKCKICCIENNYCI